MLRKKNADDLSDLTERLENMQKAKLKMEKDKDALRRQFDDVSSQVNEEIKNKSEQERLAKAYESQVGHVSIDNVLSETNLGRGIANSLRRTA